MEKKPFLKGRQRIQMNLFTTQKRKKFHEIYETYRNYMYGISYSVVHDEYDAEDIVHNSFLKLGRILDSIDMTQTEQTKMFLGTVVRNTAIDYYRKKQKHIETEGTNDPDQIEEILDKKQLETIVIDNYNYERLMKKIDELPAKYRDMLVMHYLFDLPIKEIAVQLSLSEANAYTRMCRAKSLLLKAISEEE